MFFADNNWLQTGAQESEEGSMPSSQFWQQQLIPIDQEQNNEPQTIQHFLNHAASMVVTTQADQKSMPPGGVKNVQETDEPFFTEKKSEISLEPAQQAGYTSHDLQLEETELQERTQEDQRAVKLAPADEKRFQEEYADSQKGTPQFEQLKVSQKNDQEEVKEFRSDLKVSEQSGKLPTQQTDSDLDDEDEEMKEKMAAMVTQMGKHGDFVKQEDSDEEREGKVQVLKPKMRLTQREGSLFIKKLNYDMTSQEEMMELLMAPIPKEAGVVLCTIRRDKSGFNRWYPRYELMLTGTMRFLLTGKKRAHNRTSNYLITTETKKLKKKQQGTLGKLRSNFLGTQFHIYDDGENPKKKVPTQKIRKEHGVILYEPNVLGTKGPRKMKVLLPALDRQGHRALFRPMNDVICAQSLERRNLSKLQERREVTSDDFYQQSSRMESKQNFVKIRTAGICVEFQRTSGACLCEEFPTHCEISAQVWEQSIAQNVFMQFGRVNKTEFSMDVQWPLSLFQAFAVVLSSFDFKLACE